MATIKTIVDIFPGPVLFDTETEKSSWVLTASSESGGRSPNFAKDGNKQGSWGNGNIFHSDSATKYNWLQIDFGSTMLVKGVHLYR